MKFLPGQQFSHDGVWYRILAGNRCEGDMIIEFSLDGQDWHRPRISHAQILISFKFSVEENNYGTAGKVKRGRGGWYLLDSIKSACLNGWEAESNRTETDRRKLEADKEEASKQATLF